MLATRGPGSFIGEVQVYEKGAEAQWQTCVRARDNVKVLVLYYKHVKDLITKRPEVEADVRASTCIRQSPSSFGVFGLRTALTVAVSPGIAFNCLQFLHWRN